ncbi:hypothetical protein Q5O24_05660 [Eubacteriaceae bacterium ES3]|nr:hypothetical protein Q5O24_05660 [Eubacteriaceae bacterium ES3]
MSKKMRGFRQLLPMLPNIVLTALVFFLLQSWEPGTEAFGKLITIYIPLYCICGSLIYGLKNGFHWLYPTTVFLVFLPILYLVIGIPSVILAVIYGLLALFGIFVGARFVKWRNK